MLKKYLHSPLLLLLMLLGLLLPMASQAQTITITSITNPSATGTPTNFTATVTAPAALLSAGSVQFSADGQPFGTPQAIAIAVIGNSATTAPVPFTFTTAGQHTVTATYTQTAPAANTVSASLIQIVKAQPTLAVTDGGVGTAVYGTSLTFTATVSNGFSPTGTVLFTSGTSQQFGTGVLNGGTATYTTSSLNVGTYNAIGALYSGDSLNFSASGTLATLTITAATPAVTVTASPTSINYGDPITFTASVTTPSGPAPTGTVTFSTNGGSSPTLGSATLSGGVASFTTTALPPGSQTITATYQPANTNFNAASGTTVANVTVGPAPTSTVVTSDGNPSTFGNAVTFTATVSSPAGAPTTGTVTFFDGTTALDSSPVTNPGAGVFTLTVPSAASTVTPLNVGAHSITAAFTPAAADAFHTGSKSSAITQQVNQQTSSVSISPGTLNAKFGQNVTFTATLTISGSATPTGTVQFVDTNTSTVIGSSNVSGTTVTFSTSDLPIGSYSVEAIYSGNSLISGSTSANTTALTVTASGTTLTLNASPTTVTFGQPVTLVAKVSATLPGGGVPTGTVTFTEFLNGAATATSINGGNQVAIDNNGNAVVTVSDFALGTHKIHAAYTPSNGNYNGSDNTGSEPTVTVNAAGTPVTVTSTPNPSVNGQTVTFTVTVDGGVSVPTGNITLVDSVSGQLSIPAADSQLHPTGNPNEAQAVIPFAGLSVGTHNITAMYAGTGGNLSGNGSLPGGQTVSAAGTTTSLQSSPNPSAFSQQVTLTATVSAVSPGTGTPVGTVNFLDTDGSTLGSANLSSGTASITTAVLSVGTHSLTAKFVPSGSPASFAASTSPPVSQTVGKAATTTAVAGSPSPSTFGQSVTFTATVTTTGGVPPDNSSTVTFQDTDGTTLKTVALSAGSAPGTFTASFSTASLVAASHTITATFSGDASNAGSSGQTPQVVGAASTTTALQSSAPTSTFGQPITFTAAVTANAPGGGIPAGSVTFTDTIGGTTSTLGTANLDSNGAATFSTTGTALSAGQHVITANYTPANGNDNPSSGSVTQSVNQAASNISLQASPSPSTFGQNVTMTAIVTGTGGVPPTGKVTFTNTLGSTVTTLGTATLASSGTNAQGQPTSTAVLTTSGLPAASADTLIASYPGDGSNSGGSTTFAIRVDAASTNTAVKSSLNPSTFGDAVTFTATVTSSAPSGAIPSGSVTFSDTNNGRTTTLGTATADQNGVANFSVSSLSVGVHIITAAYGGSANFQGSSNTLNQQVFEQQAAILSFNPPYLLVPGTVRDANHPLLRVSDNQTLTITGQNFRSSATAFINGVSIQITPDEVSADGTTLTLSVPPSAVSSAGFAPVQIVNNSTASGANGAPTANLPVNPAAVITNLPAPGRSDRFLRMVSVPYDYTGQNPYDILKEVTLNPVIASTGYDPDVNLLSQVGLSTVDPADPGYLVFDRWDPSLLRYLTTVPAAGQKADNVQLLLGQASWVVGGVDSQLLGLMKIGAAAGLNPTGIPLVRGWNMVGNPFPTDADLSTLSVLPVQGATLPFYSSASQPDSAVYEGIVSPIFWSWNGQNYVANHPPQTDSLNAPHTLHAYEGYWLYAYQQCTLLVNNAQP